MPSLRKLLDDPFLELLEACADKARAGIELLVEFGRGHGGNLKAISVVRQDCHKTATLIQKKLAHTAMVGLRKEDIVDLSNALSGISEATDRFAQRWHVAGKELPPLESDPLLEKLRLLGRLLDESVRHFRLFNNEGGTRQLHAQMQEAGEDAERLGAEMIGVLLRREKDPVRLIVAKDVVDGLTDIADRCTECGNLVNGLMLRYG